MPRPARLPESEIATRIVTLHGWTFASGKLHREYRFADFSEAFGWMARAALAAEKLDHHPEWKNVWATVVVDLSTHDAGGVTELDFTLARDMERLFRSGRRGIVDVESTLPA